VFVQQPYDKVCTVKKFSHQHKVGYSVLVSLINVICSGRHNVRQGNISILQHLQSDRRPGARNKLCLNRPIQYYYWPAYT